MTAMWAPDYVTVDEMSTFKNIDDDVDDVQIAVAVSAASRAIDDCCNRQFGKVDVAEERVFTAEWRPDRGRWVVVIDDVQTAAGLEVAVSDETLTGYTLEPRNAAAKGRPWERLVVDSDSAVVPTGCEYEVAVTAVWGWTTVPTTIEHATYLQASRFLSRRDSPFGVAGSPAAGSELRLLARVDPDVAVSLHPYTRARRVR